MNVDTVETVIPQYAVRADSANEPTWTDGALHMLINIDTLADRTMLGSDGGIAKRIDDQMSSVENAQIKVR